MVARFISVQFCSIEDGQFTELSHNDISWWKISQYIMVPPQIVKAQGNKNSTFRTIKPSSGEYRQY